MKTRHFLMAVCFATLALIGCRQRSAEAPPAGSFRLVVDDMLKDDGFRVASLMVMAKQPDWLSIDMTGSHAAAELLLSPENKLREGRAFFIASRVSGAHGTNAFIQTCLHVKVDGGDGGMLVKGSFESGSTTVYPVSSAIRLEDFLSMNARSGIYPLDTPIEIGMIDGKTVTLTVGKPSK